MVVEVVAYTGQVANHIDSGAFQEACGANSAALQDLRRVEGSGR